MEKVNANKYLMLIRKTDEIVKNADDEQDLGKRIYQELKGALKISNLSIAVYDQETQATTITTYVMGNIVRRSTAVKFANGLLEYVIKSKKPLYVNRRIKSFCRLRRIILTPAHGAAKTWLGVPIICQKNVLGALSIQDNHQENAYDKLHEILLSNIGAKIGLVMTNRYLHEEVRRLSLIDDLTGINNRRYFDLVLEREMKKSVKSSRPLSLLIIGLDDLNIYKKTYKGPIVDKVIVLLARYLKNNIRDTDLVARYTNDDFGLVLPETNNTGAITVAERLRVMIEKVKVHINGFARKGITISFGIATYPYNAESLDDLVRNACKALRQATRVGKSRIEII